MFDLDRQIRLKQAQHALKEGRLDEAFSIAIEKEVRELRAGQILLEDLVSPLLERAEEHLASDRLREALIDAERAVAAGGQRSDAIRLRDNVESAMAKQRGEAQAVNSVRHHLKAGRLDTGAVRLADAGTGNHAAQLERELETRRQRAREALERAGEHAQAGRLLEALASARQAIEKDSAVSDDAEVLPMLKNKVIEQIGQGLDSGDLKRAGELCSLLRESLGKTLEGSRMEDALKSCGRASEAFERGDLDGARVLLSQVSGLRPEASWINDARSSLEAAGNALGAVRSGPLGLLSTSSAQAAAIPASFAETLRATSPRNPAAQVANPPSEEAARGALLLWIDGVGTYLIVPGDRVSIGRAGSSTRPDLGLSRSGIAGHHAEVVRSDDDYFIVAAQGAVAVNGSPTPRKLLQDGDSVHLGDRSQFTFRLPTNLSSTAVITLRGNQRLDDNVQRIVLCDGHFLLGGQDNCHLQVPGTREPVVLTRTDEALVCRAAQPIVVNGKLAGEETRISLGEAVQVGDLTFTLTPWKRRD